MIPMSAFGHHVRDVFRLSTHKQVVRIYAWWVIAFVQDAFTVWNRSIQH